MEFLIALILILGTITVYMLLIKIYTILFRLTGLSKHKAKFQVISLLTNCGFTTKESEVVTASKSRRNIGIATMLTGNIFSILIVSLLINSIFKFNKDMLKESSIHSLVAFGIFIVIVFVAKIPAIDHLIEKLVEKLYHKIHHDVDNNLVTLIDMYDKDAICRIYIKKMPSVLHEVSLASSKLSSKYGLNIMSIKRKNKSISVSKDVVLSNGDEITIFGDYQMIRDLFLNGELVKPEELVSDANSIDLADYYEGNALGTVILNKVPETLKNKSLIELNLTKNFDIKVLYIKRNDSIISIGAETMFHNDDEVTLFGPYDKMKELFLK